MDARLLKFVNLLAEIFNLSIQVDENTRVITLTSHGLELPNKIQDELNRKQEEYYMANMRMQESGEALADSIQDIIRNNLTINYCIHNINTIYFSYNYI